MRLTRAVAVPWARLKVCRMAESSPKRPASRHDEKTAFDAAESLATVVGTDAAGHLYGQAPPRVPVEDGKDPEGPAVMGACSHEVK